MMKIMMIKKSSTRSNNYHPVKLPTATVYCPLDSNFSFSKINISLEAIIIIPSNCPLPTVDCSLPLPHDQIIIHHRNHLHHFPFRNKFSVALAVVPFAVNFNFSCGTKIAHCYSDFADKIGWYIKDG